MKKKQFWRISYCFAAWEAALKWQMTRKKESFWCSSNPSRKLLPNWFSEICSAFIYAFRELSLLLDCVIFRRKKIPLLPLPVILRIFCKSSSEIILAMVVEEEKCRNLVIVDISSRKNCFIKAFSCIRRSTQHAVSHIFSRNEISDCDFPDGS